MTTRIVEWKLPYTWGTAIEIDENKVISLRLRDENNLIIYDGWDNEIFVDLQLDDEITPTSAFPVGITTGRVVVDNWWDLAGTIICAKTTSGDNIKLLYADEWTLWIDNWTGTFKQIYFKWDVDTIVQAIYTYINDNANTKTFFITWNSTQRKEKLGEAISYILSWKNAIVNIWGTTYTWIDFVPWDVELGLDDIYTFSSAVNSSTGKYWELKVNVVYTNPHSSTVSTYTDTEHSVWGWWWSDIEYVTQAEYNALLPWALTDNKHYFIYEEEVWPTPWGWQPWVNTIIYYDFEHTNWTAETNMAWISNYDGTYQATPTISTLASGKKILTVNQDNALNTNNTLSTLDYDNSTINIWFNPVSITENFYFWQEWWGVQWWTIMCSDYRWSCWVCLWVDANHMSATLNYWNWQNIVITNNWTNSTAYINGVQVWQTTMTTSTWDKYFHVGGMNNYAVPSPQTATRLGKASFWSVIIENKSRTAQEISDYYDQTKWDYWIS